MLGFLCLLALLMELLVVKIDMYSSNEIGQICHLKRIVFNVAELIPRQELPLVTRRLTGKGSGPGNKGALLAPLPERPVT